MSAVDPELLEILNEHGRLPKYTHDYLPLTYEANNGDLLCHVCAQEWFRQGERLTPHIVTWSHDCDVCGDTIKDAFDE